MSRSPAAHPSSSAARGKPHSVRIIGGEWKRTPLRVLNLDGLRPTPNRVRETLFNWLGQDLDGRRCLDLFAGTGALGFEAASRGAASVVMVEHNACATGELRAVREKLSARNVEVVESEALRLAAGLAPSSFDVVFLDPPFAETELFARALPLAARLAGPGGDLYVESGEPLDPAGHEALAGWVVTREGKTGTVHYHLLKCANNGHSKI
ncbi:MAG: 16S rRNA (guanine(966)-N(2))-methyltransferase RsmD [Burkholderia sp.]|nr:MAG: Ribosomal RNA small subunit methyltransferase D [Burkholderia gladioli]